MGPMADRLHEGDLALITRGPFEGKIGTITRIDGDVVALTVDVFARDTPVHVPRTDLSVPPAAGR
jgi:transcription antitermination factor NusG